MTRFARSDPGFYKEQGCGTGVVDLDHHVEGAGGGGSVQGYVPEVQIKV